MKGEKPDVVDHLCNSLNSVAAGIRQWLHDWRIHSYPSGDRHRRGTDQDYPGTKTFVATYAGEEDETREIVFIF